MSDIDAAITAAMNELPLHPEEKRKVRKTLRRELAKSNAPAASPVRASASSDPVEAAIREGRIPESRRAHYTRLMARKPKKTAKLLSELAPVLIPPDEVEEVREFVERPQAAPVAGAGPSDYPEEWLQAGGGVGGAAPSIGGNIFAEPGTNPATTIPALPGPGEVL